MATLLLTLRPLLKAAVAGMLLLCVGACSRLLFYPLTTLVATPDNWQLVYEDIWLQSDDGTRLHGWWLPAQTPTRTEGEPPALLKAKGSVYFLHGNAENISTHIANVAWLPAEGYNVFLLDYRGYGRSEGEPDLGPVVADVRAGYAWMQQHAPPLVVLGQSLGGGLAGFVVATEAQPPAAVVLDAPVASYPRIASEVAKRNWLTWPFAPLAACAMPEQFDLETVIPDLGAPLLIFRSDEDQVVPPSHADSLYKLARAPKVRVKTSGRHTATFNSTENRQRLLSFLATHAAGH